MFNDRIILKENKRLTNKEDIDKMINFKNDLFNIKNNNEIIPLLKRYNFNIINK